MTFSSCLMSKYSENAGWYCEGNIYDTYYEEYNAVIEELALKHSVGDCRKLLERYDNYFILIWFTNVYTIRIYFSGTTNVGFFFVKLYYYGDENHPIDVYDSQSKLVSFINDLTNHFAYDAKTDTENYFKDLYDTCIEENKSDSIDLIHQDSLVGDVMYYVGLNKDRGFYYMYEKNDDLIVMCNTYEFEGILKNTD